MFITYQEFQLWNISHQTIKKNFLDNIIQIKSLKEKFLKLQAFKLKTEMIIILQDFRYIFQEKMS